ncbi:MAG: rhomboid family intramembrane serine protease [Planktomarina sp.]
MFPIRDHNPSRRIPFVTYALLISNIGIFLLYQGIASDPTALSAFYYDWGMIPRSITTGHRLDTLFTSMFLHGGWMHLAGNMLFLWIFGDNVEDKLGHGGFIVFYLVCGLLASGGQIVADPTSWVPNIGASGAIAGLLGGYLLLFPRAKVDVLLILIVYFRVFAIPAWVMLGLWLGFQIVNGIIADTSSGGIAYWAHSAGFVAGFILMFPVWVRLGGPVFWANTDVHPANPDATYPFVKSRIPKVRKNR